MKRFITFSVFIMSFILIHAQNAWINEIHYDNASTDEGEFIEVVIEDAGSYDLSDFSVILYNGGNDPNSAVVYDTKTLDNFTVGITSEGFTIYYYEYPSNGIQNGASDGMALVYDNIVITGQFLSYEGVITAGDGPAVGMTSVDIGVSESGSTLVGESLQLSGTGSSYGDFVWEEPAAETPGQLNNNQAFGAYVPDPEPTGYPTDFFATPFNISIALSWADATGEQLPLAYLIKGSENSNITLPLDGEPVADDPDLSDGEGAVNVAYGVETYVFDNLPANTTYFFKIFPYTNTGTNIDYKTDGTPPEATTTTSNISTILSEKFDIQSLGVFTEYSVSGDQVWAAASFSGDWFAKMSGYSGQVYENDDWLVSPAMNLNNYINEKLSFITAMNYTGDVLQVKISTDYEGTGNPYDASWMELQPVLSPGNWEWTSSGDIDISSFNGDAVYIAFQYTCNTTDASTWEVDNILVTGEENVGINEPSTAFQCNIFPNPSEGMITLMTSAETVEVTVYAVDGSIIFSSVLQCTGKINLSDKAQGLYFVKLVDLSNNYQITRKISIQ